MLRRFFGVLRFSPSPGSSAAANFLEQLDGFDFHPAIEALAHIVNSQQGSTYGDQRFHLDTGPTSQASLCLDPHTRKVVVQSQRYIKRVYLERVTKWDPF